MATVVARSQTSPRVQRLQELHDALSLVQLNGQAIAAADLALGTLTAVRDRFSSWSLDNARRWAAQRLDEGIGDIRRFRGPLAGLPASPVAFAAWDDLSKAIKRGMNLLFSLEDGPIGTDQTEWSSTIDYAIEVAIGTIQAMPEVIRTAVHFGAELATDTVGGVAAGLLPLWPLVVVAGLLVVAGVVVVAAGRKRGLLK